MKKILILLSKEKSKNYLMKDKYALVTGASSGIGLEIATLLAERKYNLVLVSNESEDLFKLKNDIYSKYDVKVEALDINLARNEAADEIFNYCEENNIDVEVLVNNAGFFFFGEVAETDLKKAEQKILLHVLTSSLLCTLFAKKMKNTKNGYILSVSSISAYKAFPGIAFYGSTKAYLKYFTRSLRTEMKPYSVHVSCLCPGATLTNLYHPTVVNVGKAKKFGIMMSAGKVAQRGVKGLFSDKAIIIPGFSTRLMLFFTLLMPQFIIVRLWKKLKDRF